MARTASSTETAFNLDRLPVGDRLAYSVEDAAACLGISRATLYRLVAQGQLKPRKIGARTLLIREDLVTFLAGLPKLKT